ncbi:MAG: hypothetical protein N2559_17230, partial [Anaerolineae bacterium]|nr:hypothetical protein [Anaerolineae bacterium]
QGPQPRAPRAALGTAFTYQGQLKDDGAPANGTYDFEFALFDAATAGTQVGLTVTLNNVAVTNGLFTVQLDFGNPFWQQQTYLQVRVRKSGTTSFTTLNPRQTLTAAPVAMALPGVYTNQASQFVGISRTNKITSNEVFGVNADFGASGNIYGGMYVNTVSPSGRPFYGYATGGSARAWTTYNPADSAWELHNTTRRLLQVSTDSIAQPSDANGLVKAGVIAYCSSTSPSIVRSFVAVDGTAPSVSISWNSTLNACVIDFGFMVTNRYYVAMAEWNASGARLANCSAGPSSETDSIRKLACNRYRIDGTRENGIIIVLVF